jgi:hydroxyacylglutathione hydrolase
MKSWTTKNGYDIFLVSAGRSNAYLISYGGVNALVDTGKQSAFGRLRKNLDTLNVAHHPVGTLILTHTHFDHCGNALVIREQENCRILMSEKEVEYVENGYTPLPKGTFGLTRLISRLGTRMGPGRFGYTPFKPDRQIGEEFELAQHGFRLKIISTQGHSKGSLSVIVDNEIAIVGDTMLGTLKNSIFPPFADDIAGMINSWGKLLNTGCEIFLPGHGGAIRRALVYREYVKYAGKYNLTQSP